MIGEFGVLHRNRIGSGPGEVVPVAPTAPSEVAVPVMGYGRCARCGCSSFMGGWGRRYCANLTCHHEFDDHR
jgi:hypothetical protein